MSKETEKIFKELHERMANENAEDMSEEDVDRLLQELIQKHNETGRVELTEDTAETSDDFLDLAQETENEVLALKYAKKALKLDPDNLDAELMIADLKAKDPLDYLDRLKKVVSHGTKIMKAQGYDTDEYIGDYWGFIETRPYMRAKLHYINMLKSSGMIGRAIEECEDVLRLNENDNMGVRYILMHLYAFMEDEKKALALYKKYGEYHESQILLPLSILYFKRGNTRKAVSYLEMLDKANKDTKLFFKSIVNDELEKYIDEMENFGYRPGSIEDLIVGFMENSFLYDQIPLYLFWAAEQLKGKKSR